MATPPAVVGQILTSPRFDPEDFDRERKLELDGLLQGPDDPTWIAQRAFRALLLRPDTLTASRARATSTPQVDQLDDIRPSSEVRREPVDLDRRGRRRPGCLVSTLESTLGVWKTTGPAPAPRPRQREAGPRAWSTLPTSRGPFRASSRSVDGGSTATTPATSRPCRQPRRRGRLPQPAQRQPPREERRTPTAAARRFSYRRTGMSGRSTLVRADVTAEALKEVARRARWSPQGPPLERGRDRHREGRRVRSFPESFEAPGASRESSPGSPFNLPADYLDTFLKHLSDTPDDQVRRAMDEVVAPNDRTILVVGDRARPSPGSRKGIEGHPDRRIPMVSQWSSER